MFSHAFSSWWNWDLQEILRLAWGHKLRQGSGSRYSNFQTVCLIFCSTLSNKYTALSNTWANTRGVKHCSWPNLSQICLLYPLIGFPLGGWGWEKPLVFKVKKSYLVSLVTHLVQASWLASEIALLSNFLGLKSRAWLLILRSAWGGQHRREPNWGTRNKTSPTRGPVWERRVSQTLGGGCGKQGLAS